MEEDHPSKVGEKADLQQQLSRKEAELKIAEDTIRKEQQQNQELKKQVKLYNYSLAYNYFVCTCMYIYNSIQNYKLHVCYKEL